MDSIFQVLTLAWSLQGGVLPDMDATDTVQDVFHVGPVLYAEYGFELSYPVFSGQKDDASGIYLGTSLRNEFKKGEGFHMAPIQDTYTFSGGIRWKELTIGFDHACTHSTDNFIQGNLVTQRLIGGIDRVFIKVTGKI